MESGWQWKVAGSGNGSGKCKSGKWLAAHARTQRYSARRKVYWHWALREERLRHHRRGGPQVDLTWCAHGHCRPSCLGSCCKVCHPCGPSARDPLVHSHSLEETIFCFCGRPELQCPGLHRARRSCSSCQLRQQPMPERRQLQRIEHGWRVNVRYFQLQLRRDLHRRLLRK